MARTIDLAHAVDALLRAEGRFEPGRIQASAREMIGILVSCSALYGICLGSFGWRWEQAVYSGAKLPLLLLGTAVICIPNFYVINAILGLSQDFRRALQGILAGLATVAVCLLALAPLCMLFYVSGCDYRQAVLFNGVLFAIATWCGQITLQRHYRPLVRENPQHRIARRVWVVLFVFVAIQMAWTLRPFVGWPEREPMFFREHGHLRNAYVVLAESIWKFLHGQ